MRAIWEEMENDPSVPKNSVVSPEEADGLAVVADLGEGDDEIAQGPQGSHLHNSEGEFQYPEWDDVVGEEEEIEELFENHEISALSQQLDQLQCALDDIESRNDNIHKVLLEILHSNREVRKTIAEGSGDEAENQSENNSGLDVVGEATFAAMENAVHEVSRLRNDTVSMVGLVNEITEKIEQLE